MKALILASAWAHDDLLEGADGSVGGEAAAPGVAVLEVVPSPDVMGFALGELLWAIVDVLLMD